MKLFCELRRSEIAVSKLSAAVGPSCTVGCPGWTGRRLVQVFTRLVDPADGNGHGVALNVEILAQLIQIAERLSQRLTQGVLKANQRAAILLIIDEHLAVVVAFEQSRERGVEPQPGPHHTRAAVEVQRVVAGREHVAAQRDLQVALQSAGV